MKRVLFFSLLLLVFITIPAVAQDATDVTPTTVKIILPVALCTLLTIGLLWWIESLKKWAVKFPIQAVQDFINKYLIGGWKTKLTTFISGILEGVLAKIAIVIGLVELIKNLGGPDLSPFAQYGWLTFIACGAWVAIQNMSVVSVGRAITGAREIKNAANNGSD